MPKVQNSLQSKQILIVDDSEILRESFKLKFEKLGATVYVCGTLERALSLLKGLASQDQAPNLIIADLMLPNCSGLQVLRSIRHTLAGADPIIVIASQGFNQLAQANMQVLGARAYVEKPVLTNTLFAFVLELLREDFITTEIGASIQLVDQKSKKIPA